MNINVTPEVASAHRNLEELCEKFETSVDKFYASSPQSIRPHEFYECECVPIAAACADALSEFQSAQAYEATVYESAVAEAENELSQQKRRLEESIAQSKKNYESAVAEAENELSQQKRGFEEGAAQRTRTYENTVAEADKTYHQLKSELESDAHRSIQDIENEVRQVGVDITLSVERTTTKETSKIPYNLALDRVKQANEHTEGVNASSSHTNSALSCTYMIFRAIGVILYWAIRSRHLETYHEGFFLKFTQYGGEAILLIVIIPAIMHSLWKHNRKPRALRALRSAAIAERGIILDDMEKTIANASAECDRKIKGARARKDAEEKQAAETEAEAIPLAEGDMNAKIKGARSRKEKEDKQAAEAEAEAKAERDKEVEKVRSRRDQAIEYIKHEYRAFDTRLCKCLDKFQLLVENWTTENAYIISTLNENSVQNISENGERIGSYLTRVGTVNIWDRIGKMSRDAQGDAK